MFIFAGNLPTRPCLVSEHLFTYIEMRTSRNYIPNRLIRQIHGAIFCNMILAVLRLGRLNFFYRKTEHLFSGLHFCELNGVAWTRRTEYIVLWQLGRAVCQAVESGGQSSLQSIIPRKF